MKQLTLLFGILLLSMPILAQDAALVLFSENGEAFTAILNGAKQNESPMSRVRCVDLNQEFYQVKVDFEDASLADFNSNLAIEKGMEITAIIKQNKKGRYVLRMYGSTPLSNVSVEPVADYVPLPSRQQEITVEEPIQENSSVTTIIKTETISNGTNEGIDIQMNVPGIDLKVKMDIPEVDIEMNSSYTETTTTTVTETNKMTRPVEDHVEVIEQPVAVPGYNGPTGCDWPADDSEMEMAISRIESKTFEDSKMTLAKQIAKNKCLTADQVMKVMMTFEFEESKLDFAKYAYDFTYDQGNYYVVNDAFEFELSIDELNDYLESR